MGKTAKIMLLSSLLLAVLFFILSFQSANSQGLTFESMIIKVSENFKALNTEYEENFKEISEKKEIPMPQAGTFKKIAIKNSFPSLVVRPGKTYSVALKGKVDRELSNLLTYQVQKDELTIEIGSGGSSNPTDTGVSCEITLPDFGTDLSVESKSGSVTLRQPKATKVSLISMAGQVIIEKGQINRLDIQGNSASFRIDNEKTFLQGSVESGDVTLTTKELSGNLVTRSGDIEAHTTTVPGDLKLSSATGDVIFRGKGRAPEYNVEARSGWLLLNGADVPARKAKSENFKGSGLIMTSNTGDVYLDLK